ncbi:serine/threonine-protein phosphatase 6 regulatory ankyrin repeat subunit B-like [Biomphalaria glabrata]|uniref:Serine/threonine-protein phosphatase 6 regulatory ankyrin repeat subunit B-like n=2 Tax=Biomphalaria TaxID=6525 RepID=A0A9W2Z1W8_BIOGL|nr:serine/threonine-protein phosphatase 6 regulatory ankyrin repeat subunit B-like [Biomphalaria glabrata]XP_055868923.1 serine/threonine-protein phosphatase 6 regulatory ankyrin repeat subunit B-like [Biomphalaria glabrata]XP_055868932.1 serine/threonine-protein phosphatase 6 regulatory ankyrin repeat subunit B-like [Biomphalaria glabrata]KAI8768683.1 serine/threonine-protein phosphatase 6 regulatory ankyrin repeat subunit B [Biomphalaria glabrata]KAK0054607.1 serine/threonine-protein phosphat
MGNSSSSKNCAVSTTMGMPQRERDLHIAVVNNDRNNVVYVLNQGVDINYPWNNPAVPSVKDSTTPLIAAVSLNHVEIVEILLHNGASVNRTDRNGCTPLYKAAFHGRMNLVDVLVKAGAEIDKPDKENQTPLYICVQNAIVHSSYDTVNRLLEAGASVNIADRYGRVPLHSAAHWKLKELIRILLEANSLVNVVDYKGRTPLYVCVASLSTGIYKEDLKYQVPCIKILHAAGCDMLNMEDWLRWKGPGIPAELLTGDDNFLSWYNLAMTSPPTLRNLCRKVVQKRLVTYDCPGLVKCVAQLPVPPSLKVYLSRKMFHLPML